jgi:hypothetical protein
MRKIVHFFFGNLQLKASIPSIKNVGKTTEALTLSVTHLQNSGTFPELGFAISKKKIIFLSVL